MGTSNRLDGAVQGVVSAQSAGNIFEEYAKAPPEVVADISGAFDSLGEGFCQSGGAIAWFGVDEEELAPVGR
jgi:hypothetical protein